MALHKFLSLLAVVMGFVGAVFLAKGILVLRPKDMLETTTHYSAMGWPSKQIISSMAVQKADTLIGFVCMFLALLIQVVAILVNKEIGFAKNQLAAFCSAFIFVAALTIILYVVDNGVRNYFGFEMKKLVAQDYCSKRFVGRPVDSANFKGLQDMVREYFRLERGASESCADFIKRVARHVGWTVPDDIDFSRIESDTEQG